MDAPVFDDVHRHVRQWQERRTVVREQFDLPAVLAVVGFSVLLQCLFSRLISIFPQCGQMVFPGLVIMQSVM